MHKQALTILKKLIQHHIHDGQPVGSKTLAADVDIDLSSASIRMIMADLEAAGYLSSPHTSAGRVPTAQGYRLFIDHLLTVEPLAELNIDKLRQELLANQTAKRVINKATSLLSGVTQLAGIVSLPKFGHMTIKQVEFLGLSERRVLVILVFDNHDVQNRMIKTIRQFTPSELERAGNYLTHHFAGLELRAIRRALLDDLQQELSFLESMLQVVLAMAEEVRAEEEAYLIAGETNLFEVSDASQYEQLKQLFAAFTQKRDILYLLDQSLHAQGIKIFIGDESAHEPFKGYSFVTAPYQVRGQVVGVLGVVGPTRMHYEQVISAVDVTSRLLSEALNETALP